MRLTCPSCNAQYEVAADLIPDGGREVQCSACGTVWFHGEDDGAGPTHAGRAPEPAPATQVGSDARQAASDERTGSDEAPRHSPAPRRVEPCAQVLEILRQEREHEARARASHDEDAAPEPPDVARAAPATRRDLPDDIRRTGPTERERVAAAASVAHARSLSFARKPSSFGPSASTRAAEPSRSGLLPDIEETNSSLRAEDALPPRPAPTPEAARKAAYDRGFRRGFALILLSVALLTGLYLLAPQIGARVPAAEDPLDDFVSWVDDGRLALESGVNRLTARLSTED